MPRLSFRRKKDDSAAGPFDDPNVNAQLRFLAEVGRVPAAEGPLGEERELRDKYVFDVAYALISGFGGMPAVKRALGFAYKGEDPEQCFGALVIAIAVAFKFEPIEFVRRVTGRNFAKIDGASRV